MELLINNAPVTAPHLGTFLGEVSWEFLKSRQPNAVVKDASGTYARLATNLDTAYREHVVNLIFTGEAIDDTMQHITNTMLDWRQKLEFTAAVVEGSYVLDSCVAFLKSSEVVSVTRSEMDNHCLIEVKAVLQEADGTPREVVVPQSTVSEYSSPSTYSGELVAGSLTNSVIVELEPGYKYSFERQYDDGWSRWDSSGLYTMTVGETVYKKEEYGVPGQSGAWYLYVSTTGDASGTDGTGVNLVLSERKRFRIVITDGHEGIPPGVSVFRKKW